MMWEWNAIPLFLRQKELEIGQLRIITFHQDPDIFDND